MDGAYSIVMNQMQDLLEAGIAPLKVILHIGFTAFDRELPSEQRLADGSSLGLRRVATVIFSIRQDEDSTVRRHGVGDRGFV